MKRTSEHQLTKDNAADADVATEEPQQGFERASPEVLAKRRILKVRRTPNLRPAEPTHPNPFASLSKPNEVAPPKPADAPAEKPSETPAEKPSETPKDEQVDKQNDKVEDTETRTAEVPVDKATEKPTIEPKEKPTQAPAEKREEPTPEAPEDKAAESPKEKASEDPIEKPAENLAPASDKTNAAVPAKVDPASALKPSTANTVNETRSNPANNVSSDESKPAPLPSAPQPTPALLKPFVTQANGSPKAPIIFGATTKPITFASAAQNNGFNFKSAAAAPKVEEKKPEFKQTTVVTGEEKDKELFRTRAKLYSLETSESGARWRERGVGSLKLNKNTETGKARLLMRTEATLRVVLNTPVFKEFQIDRAAERSIRFQGFDVDDQKKITSFLARFTTKDVTSDMIEAIEECRKNLK